MRNQMASRLLACGRIFSLFGVIVPLVAQGEDYTKCDSDSALWNVPYSGGTFLNNLQVSKKPGLTDEIVVVLKLSTARLPLGRVSGGVGVIIDSSGSMAPPEDPASGSDPENRRLIGAQYLIDQLRDDTLKQKNATPPVADNKLPLVSYVGYAGMPGIDTGKYEADGFNKIITYQPCSETTYPANQSTWRAGIFSMCEFLRPAKLSDTSSYNNFAGFVADSGLKPHGATSVKTMLETMTADTVFNNASFYPASGDFVSKNVVMITDGLPDIPKKIADAQCTGFLSYEDKKTLIDPQAPANGKQYCVNRQFRVAAAQANALLESNMAKWGNINLYNILFVSSGLAFVDVDEYGLYNPADFLLENTARTGNRKVKFRYIRTVDSLKEHLNSLLRNFDTNALQKLDVSVKNAANQTISYTAVTSAEFPVSGTQVLYTVKLLNLKTGTNQVTLTSNYGDYSSSTTFNVLVREDDVTTTGYTCKPADCARTVDGDDPASFIPDGDGVLPLCNTSVAQGEKYSELNRFYRVWRNKYLKDWSDSDLSQATIPEEDNTAKRAAKLRFQGGTGNCGVVAGVAGFGSFGILSLPLALSFLLRRRRRVG